jgi:hypothetical protein
MCFLNMLNILNISTILVMLCPHLRLSLSLFKRCKKEWVQTEQSVLLEFIDFRCPYFYYSPLFRFICVNL